MRDAITYSGPIRLYHDAGQSDAVWCIAAVSGQWHINVRSIAIDGAYMRCVYGPRDEGKPHGVNAWLEGRANVTITDDGRAVVKPEEPKS
jgi:hypothetical protein